MLHWIVEGLMTRKKNLYKFRTDAASYHFSVVEPMGVESTGTEG
jgi:hypothetical protein